MNKPTGKLAFAYATIARLEARVAELEAAQPASEPVAWGVDAAKLLSNAMKPSEIAGPADAQKRRVGELLSWFARLADGQANPKWTTEHAFELAYYIAAAPQPAAKPAQAQTIVTEREPHPNAFMQVPQGTEITAHWPSLAEPVARDGWVMVPVEPAPEMRSAAIYIYDQWGWNAVPKLWAAMLAASPTQPRPQPLTEQVEFTIAEGYRLHKYKQGTNVCVAFHQGVRFAEQHHGITAQEPT